MNKRKVFLVPGFFGFTRIGALNYFHRVSDILSAALARRGIDAEIIECETQPTGSIPARARRLIEQVVAAGGLESDELHFVGHSTGGLDVRLLASPGVRLLESDIEQQLGARMRTIISLATPHFGTPLASFFTTLQGKNLLRLLTVLATSNEGRYAIFGAAQLASLLSQIDDNLGRRNTLLDVLSERLLARVTLRRDDPLWKFLEEISSDQGAIIHLTPEGMDLFNAAVIDRASARYYCVAVAAPPPSVGGLLKNLRQLERATTYTIFSILYGIASREHRHYPYPSLAASMSTELRRLLPFAVDSQTNDGVVPTRSQLYGQLIDAVVADHLDVVGQFSGAGNQAHSDWLASGSNFDETLFVGLWDNIAGAISGGRSIPDPSGVGSGSR